jgi:uncharacterized protein (DUF2141 family)
MTHRPPFVAAVVVAAALCTLSIVCAPAHAATCANVEVQNVRPEQGMLMIVAYGDAESYNKTPMAAVQLRAGAATMRFPLCGLDGSTVALKLFQDLNSNGKLDSNVLGVPSEPWGASGTPAAMAAPTWATTAVPLDGTTIVVKLSQ